VSIIIIIIIIIIITIIIIIIKGKKIEMSPFFICLLFMYNYLDPAS